MVGGQEYYMPGFWLPLNRPVGYADLPYNNLKERQGSPRPKLEYEWI